MGRGPYFSVTKKRKVKLIQRMSHKQQARIRKLDITKHLDSFFNTLTKINK